MMNRVLIIKQMTNFILYDEFIEINKKNNVGSTLMLRVAH
jgi:hypothetical protein